MEDIKNKKLDWKEGLNSQQVAQSKKEHGDNSLSKKQTKTIFQMFLETLKDIWIKILIAALGVKIVITILGIFFPTLPKGNDAIEIVSILMAIILATGFSTISEYRNTSRSEALQEEYNKTYAKVIRSGKLISILTSDIVKGDIILLQSGDKVPVDGILLEGDLKVSQAALNGESRDEIKTFKKFTVERNEKTLNDLSINDILDTDLIVDDKSDETSTDYSNTCKVFMGSVVSSGEAYMKATVVGDATELGKINKSLTENDEEERLDTSSLKLQKVAGMIGKLGVSAALISAVLQVVLGIARATEAVTVVSVLLLVAEAVMLMASIVVMAVPEGLPMMNSSVQSMNTESLYKKNILVSHKPAFSDAAYMDVLFSDKTGTITKGQLTFVESILGNGIITNEPMKYDEFIEALTLNNASKVSDGKAIGSNNMDRALLTYALSNGYKEENKAIDKVKEGSHSLFDSEKKCATIQLKDGSLYWKGATELIIDEITHYKDNDGCLKEFTSADKNKLVEIMKTQAQRTMKMLAIVKKEKYFDNIENTKNTKEVKETKTAKKVEKERTVLFAIACLRDDVRDDAVNTIKTLTKAGIQTVMVTGDAKETAVAIAKEARILTDSPNDIVLTHEELEQLSDDELKEKIKDLKVVSRAKPLDKKRLVTIAQSLDHVVGMTGDGVNDAPALKQADIGFAMGDGTAVAQEAGDVIILNNSLTSIKDCVLNSRTMSKSVGKFLIFQLTVNVATLLMNIIAPVLGWMEPFSIVEILWINLIMDTLAALAFGGEPILERYMNSKPAKRTDDILTTYIKSAIGTSAIFITLGSIVILENIGGILTYVTPSNYVGNSEYERTFMFAFFIYSIIFNSLNTRSENMNLFEHIASNKRFIFVMGGIFIMQTLLLQFGGAVFSTVPLTLKAYLVAIVLALLIIPVDMIRKAIVNKK